ncbi:NEDD8 ultimate buster 1 [Dissostichus eleginoides]|uniref:NEDD8 ultimate buster 1 n=1 Tax=Dissostichus eleginoides TaxID=100907 RepID=A0AAD9ERY2_DISEL|nr:NEDD8 ultimate buster 1 [Dissostichus eleginoides]
MADQNLESKLKQRLKQEKIQLWIPPYTEEDNRPGTRHMQDLAERFAPLLCVEALQVESALEGIRVQAVIRWRGNQTFRETSVASVELLLPRGCKKDPKTKNYLETRLDVLAQEVDRRGVRTETHQTDPQREDSVCSEDTSPFLEIADQRGNPLNIPHQEKKALILAMGFHEKGRSLMKKKQFDNALCHLLQADQQFSKCGSALLSSVDNFAVLQLDIVWSYRALEALSCLEDGKLRLLRAEDAFLKVYGEQQQRLRMIKSLLSYLEGNDTQARQQLSKVEALFARLSLDSEKMSQLVSLGFSEREARLGLRATQGDIQEAEREQLQQRERQKRRRRSEVVSTLTELGFSRRDASKALQLADGDVDAAYQTGGPDVTCSNEHVSCPSCFLLLCVKSLLLSVKSLLLCVKSLLLCEVTAPLREVTAPL